MEWWQHLIFWTAILVAIWLSAAFALAIIRSIKEDINDN